MSIRKEGDYNSSLLKSSIGLNFGLTASHVGALHYASEHHPRMGLGSRLLCHLDEAVLQCQLRSTMIGHNTEEAGRRGSSSTT